MTEMPGVDIRFEEVPGHRGYGLIVCETAGGKEAILGIGRAGATDEEMAKFRIALGLETRKVAAAYVAGWNGSGIVRYLSGFKDFEMDADEFAAFDAEVAHLLGYGLRDDDPFRVALALNLDLGIRTDRRIIDYVESLLQEVSDIRSRPDTQADAAKLMEIIALQRSPMLKALAKEREVSKTRAPTP